MLLAVKKCVDSKPFFHDHHNMHCKAIYSDTYTPIQHSNLTPSITCMCPKCSNFAPIFYWSTMLNLFPSQTFPLSTVILGQNADAKCQYAKPQNTLQNSTSETQPPNLKHEVSGVLFVPFRPDTRPTSLICCIVKWLCNLKTFLYQIRICFSAYHQGTLLRDIHLLAPNLSMHLVLKFHALKWQRLMESTIYSVLFLCISYSNPGAPETTIHSASSTMFLGNRI